MSASPSPPKSFKKFSDSGSSTRPTLWVVATPLGNLGDLSSRATKILREVPLVLAEDTRVSRKLLHFLSSSAALLSCHQHSEFEERNQLLTRIESAGSAALVTDAGTPGVRDPGRWLIEGAWDRGFLVAPVPGPSAVTAALGCSGFEGDRWRFLGYLPKKEKQRQEIYELITQEKGTFIFFLTPHEAEYVAKELAGCLGTRRLLLAREMTKLHETLWRGFAADLPTALPSPVRGEMTVVIEGAEIPGSAKKEDRSFMHLTSEEHARALMQMENLKPKEAARRVAEARGLPVREVYQRLLGDGGVTGDD